jgi:cytoskeletal protein CcmA (bactofilin family)
MPVMPPMPPGTKDKLLVCCPACGHKQPEPKSAISTNCRACGKHIELAEAGRPQQVKASGPELKRKPVKCFDCGVEQEVAVAAQSTLCRRCGRYIDLADYRITSAVSKNFKTRGNFVIEAKGYVFNTEAIVGDAIIKGRFLGKLQAERTLTIHSSAEIKGTFYAGKLIIPAGTMFTWKTPIVVSSAEIAGELVGELRADQSILLKSTARFFGQIAAARLAVEEGAVLVGTASVDARA